MGLREIPFTKQDGLRVPVPGNRPIDFLFLLVDVIFLEGIVQKVNAYTLELLGGPNTTLNSRIHRWKDITVDELKILLGLLTDMGLNPKPTIQDCWIKTKTFIPVYGKFMSRDRFLLILRYLNCDSFDRNDLLSKIRFCVDYFNNKMKEMFYPQKNLSLDEGMVLWRGRLYFRQYIKNKRHKYGIKLYTLCDPHGLTLKFLIYSGLLDDLGGKGHAANVVLNLMQDKLNCGHSLYMDNFYNSKSLAAKLLSNNTYCTGTLRMDRKYIPQDVKSAVLRKGATVARNSEGIMVGKWKDKRVVQYISTEYVNEMATAINRRKIESQKPLLIVKYNAFMKGVARSDQMQSYYPLERKTLRWYKKTIIHTFQMLIVNSLHNDTLLSDRPKKMPILEFTKSLVN